MRYIHSRCISDGHGWCRKSAGLVSPVGIAGTAFPLWHNILVGQVASRVRSFVFHASSMSASEAESLLHFDRFNGTIRGYLDLHCLILLKVSNCSTASSGRVAVFGDCWLLVLIDIVVFGRRKLGVFPVQPEPQETTWRGMRAAVA